MMQRYIQYLQPYLQASLNLELLLLCWFWHAQDLVVTTKTAAGPSVKVEAVIAG